MSFTLDNGLKVVHHYEPATAMIAMELMYNVGSRDEHPDHTGMAHLFEHLMFGGSVNIPDYDTPLQLAGGVSNAWTSADFTDFTSVVPAVNAETLFRLESDRMLSLAFSDKALRVQRQVVVEEFKEVCLNRPYGDMDHHLRRLVYRQHPYRFPVIGKEFSHIEQVGQEDVRRWFHSHYAPNNAVLSVAGNITEERLRHLAEKWFGSIPSRPVSPRRYADEPRPAEARKETVYGDVPQTAIVLAYQMPGYGKPGFAEADMISDVLSNGKGSRLYRNLLVGTDMFAALDASITGSEHPGMLMVNARLRDNGPEAEERAIAAIEKQLDALRDVPVLESELERCVNRVESERTFARMDYVGMANALVTAAMHGEGIDDSMTRYRAVTPDSLQQTAKDILAPNRCCTLIYRPKPAV